LAVFATSAGEPVTGFALHPPLAAHVGPERREYGEHAEERTRKKTSGPSRSVVALNAAMISSKITD